MYLPIKPQILAIDIVKGGWHLQRVIEPCAENDALTIRASFDLNSTQILFPLSHSVGQDLIKSRRTCFLFEVGAGIGYAHVGDRYFEFNGF